MSDGKAAAIHAALRRIDGIKKFMGRREIKQLPELLWEGEVPESLATGRYASHDGLLVATNKRAIFIHKGLFSLTVEDFPYDRISSIEYHEGLFAGDMSIHLAGYKARVGHMRKGQARSFAEHLRRNISTPPQLQLGSIFVEPISSEEKLTAMERLAYLKDQGVLSEEEFEAEKQRTLAGYEPF